MSAEQGRTIARQGTCSDLLLGPCALILPTFCQGVSGQPQQKGPGYVKAVGAGMKIIQATPVYH